MNRYLRVRHRILQTPVVRFEHPESGRRVTVVATVHMGEPAYYEHLLTMISELEAAGAVVCYESAAPALESKVNQEWAAASDDERAAWVGEARTSPLLSGAAGRYLGWVDQWATLGSPATWRYEDRSSLDYVRRVGAQELMHRQRALAGPFRRLTQEQQEAQAGGAWALSARLSQFAWWPRLHRMLLQLVDGAAASAARADDALVGERNRRVLASLPADSDAVLPWGAGHLPGLAAGLRTAGYRRRNTTWVTVGKLPAIWQIVRDFWPGVRAVWAATGDPDQDTLPPSQPDTAA